MFVMSVSFHKQEDGLDHQDTMPTVPPPEDLPSEQEFTRQDASRACRRTCAPIGSASAPSRCGPSTCRAISTREPASRRAIRLDARQRAPARRLTRCINVCSPMLSDFSLLDTALIAHGKLMFDAGHPACQPRSCAVVSPALPRRRLAAVRPGQPFQPRRARFLPRRVSTRARALLVASVAQEGLMRSRASAYVPR